MIHDDHLGATPWSRLVTRLVLDHKDWSSIPGPSLKDVSPSFRLITFGERSDNLVNHLHESEHTTINN